MDETLPTAVGLRLQKALGQWRQWSPRPRCEPSYCAVFEHGISNTSFRVGDGTDQWVVRIDGIEPSRLGLNRQVEQRALQLAAAAQLAPRPVYHNPELGVLVCEYLAADNGEEASLEELARLLRAVQALPAVHYRLDPLQRARLYQQRAGLERLPKALEDACSELADTTVPYVLCHNDLLRANRIVSRGRLYALDWEYAAMGDPCFDLAAVIEGDGLDEEAAATLYRTWLAREPDARECRRLTLQRIVYRELGQLWEQALPRCRRGN